MPGVERITKELNETINDLRTRYERDETLQLIKKVGDNIPVFIELLDLMKYFKGMIEDVAPAADKIPHEIGNTINELRLRYERDETLTLIKKVGDHIPTFIEMLDLMSAFKGMVEDVMPTTDKIVHELTPTINMLRETFEKDELLELLKRTGDNMGAFNKLLDFLEKFHKSGDLDYALETLMTKETEYMLRGMEKCAVVTMKELMEKPLKPGFKTLFSAMRNPEVQKGFVLMTTFAKNMPQCMLDTAVAAKEELSKEEVCTEKTMGDGTV
ncbi:protein containing DUF1641 [Candidatus Omnitrophus magneticus]|uniref:Protein containing DUF1641 n=1 Tax=Candidatus Omnitrophus magneticus TaxID=1609969 RepID=A0A0F0CPW1_9BACT|nr:protein containing DUF1641 [Candidatus Omnitrophus magneticus]